MEVSQMPHPISGQTAIVGIGATPQGKLPGSTPLSLAVQALDMAIHDSGLQKSEIDGLLTMPGTTSPEGILHYLRVGEAVGINPRFTGSMFLGGATAGSMIQQAVAAIHAGMANTVACVFADTARTGGSRFDFASGWGDSFGIWGMFGAAANAGITASRHMALYGTTSLQLAEVAVACRYHASLDPTAVMRKPITVDDHQSSPWIVKPFRLLDCCLITDGGVAVIVTSSERAKDLKSRPVYIKGMGQSHTTETISNPEWWYMPHQKRSIDHAYEMAGIGPRDIQVAQFYDSFTINIIFWLEHGGFCERGEGGGFVENGRIMLGGDLPINTNGGNLSHSYTQGWLHIVEGVRQVRGESEERQVPNIEHCLVTGRGMTLNTSAALILSKEL
jgi:acetyl-CoA acetyltransferase